MNIKRLFAGALGCLAIGVAQGAPDIEGVPLGYRKIYSNGYIELACGDRRADHCSITIGLAKTHHTYALDLSQYGYKRAWDPIGAFISQKKNVEPMSFYFAVDCSREDYVFSERAEGEVKCTALGRIAKGKAFLEQIKIEPLSEGDTVYRDLESAQD
jgi:hypothetical protein